MVFEPTHFAWFEPHAKDEGGPISEPTAMTLGSPSSLPAPPRDLVSVVAPMPPLQGADGV
jgi:hypothetical protein